MLPKWLYCCTEVLQGRLQGKYCEIFQNDVHALALCPSFLGSLNKKIKIKPQDIITFNFKNQ